MGSVARRGAPLSASVSHLEMGFTEELYFGKLISEGIYKPL